MDPGAFDLATVTAQLGPTGVLGAFAYFALQEMRQLRVEVSGLSSGVWALIGEKGGPGLTAPPTQR